MAITEKDVDKYVNGRLRPRAEQIRALFAAIADDQKEWPKISVPNDPKEILDDGRKTEGVTDVTGEDINVFVAILEKLRASVSDLTDSPIIQKFCVRPLL